MKSVIVAFIFFVASFESSFSEAANSSNETLKYKATGAECSQRVAVVENGPFKFQFKINPETSDAPGTRALIMGFGDMEYKFISQVLADGKTQGRLLKAKSLNPQHAKEMARISDVHSSYSVWESSQSEKKDFWVEQRQAENQIGKIQNLQVAPQDQKPLWPRWGGYVLEVWAAKDRGNLGDAQYTKISFLNANEITFHPGDRNRKSSNLDLSGLAPKISVTSENVKELGKPPTTQEIQDCRRSQRNLNRTKKISNPNR